MFLKVLSFFMPWALRRRVLQSWYGFEIHPRARIGIAWIFPGKLIMAEGARIDHFTVAVNLDRIELGLNATIGRGNWITGFPTRTDSQHFKHQSGRKAELLVGQNAAITKYHHLDCTNQIEIGAFTTIAGYRSQFLTHSIDVLENRQDSAPIKIGEYVFVGTNVVVLGGSSLPSYSILSAKSMLNKDYKDQWKLYGGVPARMIKDIPTTANYFNRKEGYVY